MQPVTISGALTERDMKRNIAHPFTLPEGVAELRVRLSFSPARVGGYQNMICLTLIGPHGFRGAGHRHGSTHEVIIAGGSATPGYLAGPLPAGEWSVLLDTHMVMPGEPCRYELTIAALPGAAAGELAAPQPPATTPARPGPGWFRGDLHAHTVHSDAGWTAAELLAAARARGLDFATITDHNTTAHMVGLPDAGELLVMGGMELTTFWGHALSLGTRGWVDWRVAPGRTMPQIADEVRAAGGLFVIAHPHAPGDPECTGCDWRYVEMMPGVARHVEIWNGLWGGDSNNERALALWYSWLGEGLRITATAGTDAHGPAPASVRPGFSVVWAEQLSEPEILAAIRRGSLYLSSGPTLDLRGEGGGRQAIVGGELPRGPISLSLAWAGCPAGATLRLIGGGQLADEIIIDEQDQIGWSIDDPAPWYVVEVRADEGDLLAITNPIYVGEGDR